MELTPRPFISKFSLEIPNNIVRAAFLSCGQVEANRRTTKACCMPFDRDACAVSPPVSLQITIVFPSRYCPGACVGANGRTPSCGRCSPCPLSLFLLPRNSSTSFLVFGLEIKGIRGKKISPVRLNIFIKTRKRGSDLFISTALKDLPRERRSRGDSGQQNSSLSTVGRPTLAFRSANKDVAILQSSARHHNCHPLCLEVA